MRNLHDIHRMTSVFDDLWRLRDTRRPGQALRAGRAAHAQAGARAEGGKARAEQGPAGCAEDRVDLMSRMLIPGYPASLESSLGK